MSTMRNLNYDTCTFIYPTKPQPSQLIKPSLANPITKPSTTKTEKYCSIPNIVYTNVNIIQQPIATTTTTLTNPSIKYPSSNSISKYIISNSNNTNNVNIYNDDNDDDVFTTTSTNITHHPHHPHLELRSNSSSSTLNTSNSSSSSILLKAKYSI
jgi:hypothetical protein